MATGVNRHKTVCGVETWQTAGFDSRPARVTHNGSHLSMMHWIFYEDSSVSVRFCQMWDVTFLGSYDVQKSMFRMHWNMQHLACMRANMSVHINKCLNCGCTNMHFFACALVPKWDSNYCSSIVTCKWYRNLHQLDCNMKWYIKQLPLRAPPCTFHLRSFGEAPRWLVYFQHRSRRQETQKVQGQKAKRC